MKTVTVRFVVRNEAEFNALDHEIRHSHLLNEWPVVEWSSKESTSEEIEWFKNEYEGEGEGDTDALGEGILESWQGEKEEWHGN